MLVERAVRGRVAEVLAYRRDSTTLAFARGRRVVVMAFDGEIVHVVPSTSTEERSRDTRVDHLPLERVIPSSENVFVAGAAIAEFLVDRRSAERS